MIQIPHTKPERYIFCPSCGKSEHGVSHLRAGTQTAWYCDDCGVRFSLEVISPDEIRVEVLAEYKERRLVTLRSDGPVTLVVEGLRFFPSRPGEDQEAGERYYYDEGTCPTNYVRDVVEVRDENGESDPHGIFTFVKSEPWPAESPAPVAGRVTDWRELP
jgi:ribosomal protein L37AE/L43A